MEQVLATRIVNDNSNAWHCSQLCLCFKNLKKEDKYTNEIGVFKKSVRGEGYGTNQILKEPLRSDSSIKKPRLSGITKHGWTQTIFYIMTIQTITVRPTKFDLSAHDIRLGRIYFHLTLLIRCFVLTDDSWGILGIRWPTILLSLPAG